MNKFDKVNEEIKKRLQEKNTAYIEHRRIEFEKLLESAKAYDDAMDGRKRRRRTRTWLP